MSNLVNDFEVRKETLRAIGGNPDGLANIYEVDLEILKLIGSGGGEGIPDAPIDGVQYARQNGEWTPVESGVDWNTIKQKLAEDGVESIKFIMGNEEVILTADKVKTLLNQTVLPDAPSDGKQYARQDGNWTTVEEGITDAPSDGTQYARKNGSWTPVEEGLTDAPSDGKTYGRNNGTWTEVEEGITDSPYDGQQYARQDGAWAVVEKGITDSPIDGVQYARQDGTWTPVEMGLDWNTIKQKLAGDGVESIKFIMAGEEVILTASEVKTLLNQTVLPDAPSDGKTYGRNNGAWTPVEEGITDAPADGTQYARQNGNWTPVEEGITDAPADGTQYARQDGAWAIVEKGILDAPIDGVQYARKNGEWTPVDSGIDWNTIKQKLAEDGVESIKFIIGNEQVILTASEVKTLINQTVLPDAPSDGQQYARQDGAWTVVESVEPGISDAPSDGTQYARQNGAWTPVTEGITDSPSDGQQYARQNGNWTVVEEGLPDAPSDGKTYGRNNGAWTHVEEGISDAPSDGQQYARQDGAWVEAEPSKVKTTNNTTMQFWSGTQQEYDAITTKDANTLYIIK